MSEIVTKAAAVVEDVETENPNGAFEVILSAATLDRDGEVIESRAFDPLPDHIPFDIDHGMTVTTTVGSGTPYYDEAGSLRVKGTYASTPLAQEVRTLVSEGHVRTTSVTFMAAEREEKSGTPHVVKAELLNGTFTPIPSNRQAVVLSSKSLAALTDEKVGARNSAKDAETIQAMHDASVGLGAACGKSHGAEDTKSPTTDQKAVVGSLEATQERVRDALNDAYGTDNYVWLRATLPDAVIYGLSPVDGGSEEETYRESYTDDGSVVTLGGDAELVDLNEVVVPDPDTEQSADTAASRSAADQAADKDAAKSADEGSVNAARWDGVKSLAESVFKD